MLIINIFLILLFTILLINSKSKLTEKNNNDINLNNDIEEINFNTNKDILLEDNSENINDDSEDTTNIDKNINTEKNIETKNETIDKNTNQEINFHNENDYNDKNGTANVQSNSDSKNEEIPGTYSLNLFMVGDALIHSEVYKDALQNNGKYNFNSMLDNIKPIASKYDLAYYNQETILGGDNLGISGRPKFNSPQSVGDAFIDAGFNLVSLANNHTLDKGEVGILNSVKYWNSKSNVITSGQWSNQQDRDNIKIYKKNSITFAFISYTTCTNGAILPLNKDYLTNIYSLKKAKEDIAKVRDKVDFIIVAMHWGDEYTFTVNNSQTTIANDLADLGVDLIIGSHPHVVQPVEYINNKQTFVIYSLGNFISNSETVERLSGLMMEVTLRKIVDENNKVTKKITNPKADLIYTYKDSNNSNFKVIPYYSLNDDILNNYNSYYENLKKVVLSKEKINWGLSYKS